MSKFDDLLEMSEEDANEVMDAEEEATAIVYGLRVGDTLTQTEYDAIQLFDKMYRDESEHQVSVFHRGYQAGLARGAGADTAKLIEERDAARARAVVANASSSAWAHNSFLDGARACREMMARFVETGGDPQTAASIRANWRPAWGANPDAPEDIASPPAISVIENRFSDLSPEKRATVKHLHAALRLANGSDEA